MDAECSNCNKKINKNESKISLGCNIHFLCVNCFKIYDLEYCIKCHNKNELFNRNKKINENEEFRFLEGKINENKNSSNDFYINIENFIENFSLDNLNLKTYNINESTFEINDFFFFEDQNYTLNNSKCKMDSVRR